MDLKEEAILGEDIGSHWYYRAKAAALTRLVRASRFHSILDVGAGSGFFSKHLLSHSMAERAMCVDPFYAEEKEAIVAGKSLMFRRHVQSSDADLVLMMDVLEHVEDDLALLTEYVAKVESGSQFLVTVPAFGFLWSGHDVFLGHYRRYRLHQVVELMRRAGLVVERRCYYFGLVFPIAAILRLVKRLLGAADNEPRSDLRRHSAAVNGLLVLLCKLERPLMTFNRLAGLSVFCLARKP